MRSSLGSQEETLVLEDDNHLLEESPGVPVERCRQQHPCLLEGKALLWQVLNPVLQRMMDAALVAMKESAA